MVNKAGQFTGNAFLEMEKEVDKNQRNFSKNKSNTNSVVT